MQRERGERKREREREKDKESIVYVREQEIVKMSPEEMKPIIEQGARFIFCFALMPTRSLRNFRGQKIAILANCKQRICFIFVPQIAHLIRLKFNKP